MGKKEVKVIFTQVKNKNIDPANFDVKLIGTKNGGRFEKKFIYEAMLDEFMPLWVLLYPEFKDMGIMHPKTFHKKLIEQYKRYQKMVWDRYTTNLTVPRGMEITVSYNYENEAFTEEESIVDPDMSRIIEKEIEREHE